MVLSLGRIYIVMLIIHLYVKRVHADGLSHFTEASNDSSDTRCMLELYKASQVSISENELILDSIGSWSGRLLKQQLSSSAEQRTPLLREVK